LFQPSTELFGHVEKASDVGEVRRVGAVGHTGVDSVDSLLPGASPRKRAGDLLETFGSRSARRRESERAGQSGQAQAIVIDQHVITGEAAVSIAGLPQSGETECKSVHTAAGVVGERPLRQWIRWRVERSERHWHDDADVARMHEEAAHFDDVRMADPGQQLGLVERPDRPVGVAS
jgi:hypothetical protein